MITPELIRYVRENLSQGIPVQDIVQGLRDAGWSGEDIASAFHEAQSSVVPPPTPHPLANSTTPTVASPSTIQKPTHKKLLIGLILSLLVIVIGAGGAYAYFTIINPSPETVIAQAEKNFASLTAFTEEGSITISATSTSPSPSASIPASGSTVFTFHGAVDNTNTAIPKISLDASAVASADLFSFNFVGHLRRIGQVLYFMVEKNSLVDYVSSGLNKGFAGTWYSLDPDDITNTMRATGAPENAIAKVDAVWKNNRSTLPNLDQRTRVLEALKAHPFFTVAEKLPSESLVGQDMWHYQLALDTDKTFEFLGIASQIENTATDTAALSASIATMKDALKSAHFTVRGLEIWIGKQDRFLHRFKFTIEAAPQAKSSDSTPSGTVRVLVDFSFNNFNKPVPITPPEGTQSFVQTFLLPALQRARAKGNDAVIEGYLASLRSTAEIYYSQQPNGGNYGPPYAHGIATPCPTTSGNTMFGSPDFQKIFASIRKANGGKDIVCATDNHLSGALSYAISSPLATSGTFCVDSTGAASLKKTARVVGGRAVCR